MKTKLPILFMLSAVLSFGQHDFDSRKGRIEYAKFLLLQVSKLDDRLSSLTPREQDWLEKEQAAIDSISDPSIKVTRLIKLQQTKEFSVDFLKAKCATAADALRTVERTDLSIEDELWQWMRYLRVFLAQGFIVDAIRNLREKGVLSEQDLGTSPETYASVQIFYCHEILKNVIMPHYSASIMRR